MLGLENIKKNRQYTSTNDYIAYCFCLSISLCTMRLHSTENTLLISNGMTV
jgi:hypothetical protein